MLFKHIKKLFLCKHLKCHILSQAVKNDQNVYYLTYVWDGDGERERERVSKTYSQKEESNREEEREKEGSERERERERGMK